MLGLKLNHVSKSSYRTWKRLQHYSAHCKENPCTSPSYCKRPIIQMHFQEIALFPFKFHLSFSYRVNWQHYEFRCWSGAAHAINHYLNLCSDHVHIMLIRHSELITWTLIIPVLPACDHHVCVHARWVIFLGRNFTRKSGCVLLVWALVGRLQRAGVVWHVPVSNTHCHGRTRESQVSSIWDFTWWRHDMERLLTLLSLCEGNPSY